MRFLTCRPTVSVRPVALRWFGASTMTLISRSRDNAHRRWPNIRASPRRSLFSAPISCILGGREGRDVRMAQILQAGEIPRQGPRKQYAVVVLTALGVVYGDIGTSTLYGLRQAVDAGGGPATETVMGIVSLSFWV